MIKTLEQAIAVQRRRRAKGLKGRAKAVRRWFKRQYNTPSITIYMPKTDRERCMKEQLEGNFAGCRTYAEMVEENFTRYRNRDEIFSPQNSFSVGSR